MQLWHNAASTRPCLSRMGSDYCSAPGRFRFSEYFVSGINLCQFLATSVDAERAFSTGRRQVNFLQTNMSSQTFKAKMAVNSWASSEVLYPGFKYVSSIISNEIDLAENPFAAPGLRNLEIESDMTLNNLDW